MKEYLLVFRGGLDIAAATESTINDAMVNWKTWMEELAAAGKLGEGRRLSGRGAAVLSGSKKMLRDGPFAEGKEVMGGYLLIKASSFEEALELSKGCPIFIYDGSLELREIV